MALRFVWLAGVLLLLNAGLVRSTGLSEDLSFTENYRLAAGKPLVLEADVPGEPWPVLTIRQVVNCPPEVLAGVFWDSELDSSYLPGCLAVRILSKPQSFLQEAEFRLKMPLFLPEEVYVSRIELLPRRGGVIRILWNVTDSRYAKSCAGEIRIESFEGKSLMCYRNFMVPKSRVAVLLRGPAKDRVVESVASLVAQAEKEFKFMPVLVERQQRELREALR